MKKLILIALLIVGCAPTKPPTATFYIGMTEKEFIQGNNIVSKSNIISKSDKFVKINSGIIIGDTVSTFYAEKQTLLSFYYFEFNYDTLAHVYAGAKNWIVIKPIDYSKYPNSKPE